MPNPESTIAWANGLFDRPAPPTITRPPQPVIDLPDRRITKDQAAVLKTRLSLLLPPAQEKDWLRAVHLTLKMLSRQRLQTLMGGSLEFSPRETSSISDMIDEFCHSVGGADACRLETINPDLFDLGEYDPGFDPSLDTLDRYRACLKIKLWNQKNCKPEPAYLGRLLSVVDPSEVDSLVNWIASGGDAPPPSSFFAPQPEADESQNCFLPPPEKPKYEYFKHALESNLKFIYVKDFRDIPQALDPKALENLLKLPGIHPIDVSDPETANAAVNAVFPNPTDDYGAPKHLAKTIVKISQMDQVQLSLLPKPSRIDQELSHLIKFSGSHKRTGIYGLSATLENGLTCFILTHVPKKETRD